MGKEVNLGDLTFRWVAALFAGGAVLTILIVGWELLVGSRLSLHTFGWKFLIHQKWDPVKEVFGALPFVFGTLVSSFLALLIAVPISLGVAIFLAEFAPASIRSVSSFLIELLAAVPSVIYGLWGIFVLAPWMRETIQPFLAKYFGFLPLFSGPAQGYGMLTGGVILAIMILPTVSSVSREVLRSLPNSLREGALALGSTRWEAVQIAILPCAKSGIIGAVILGLGRALGETMAVTMVIGNRPEISASLFAPSYTMASVIANEFTEATGDVYLSALSHLGLVLFGVTLLMNIFARLLVRKSSQVRL